MLRNIEFTMENRHIELAVLAILTGTPISEVEQAYGIEHSALVSLTELYRSAGQQALIGTSGKHWHYWRVPFPVPPPTSLMDSMHREVADDVLLNDIGPLCTHLIATGQITQWWFMRKADGGAPHFRLRIFGEEPQLTQVVIPFMEQELDRMQSAGRIRPYTSLIYEAEIGIFGGGEGMDLAHDFFSKDAAALYQWLRAEREVGVGEASIRKLRPEASLLVLHRLLHGAGLDIFEQWDVWLQMKKYRPWSTNATAARHQKNALLLSDLIWGTQRHLREVFSPPLYAVVMEWGNDFEAIGKQLAQLNRSGKLRRGIRNVLTSYIIFHWNRMNFNVAMQSELARLGDTMHFEHANQSQPTQTHTVVRRKGA